MDTYISVWETGGRAKAAINHETDFVEVSVELGHGDHTPPVATLPCCSRPGGALQRPPLQPLADR